MSESGPFLIRWVAVGAIGTLLGLGAGGFVGLMGLATGSFGAAVTAGLMFGAVIGVSIGLAQGGLLSGRIDTMSSSRWAGYTTLGAAAAWAAVAYPIGLLLEADSPPSWLTRLAVGAGVGLTAGGIVGLGQWFDFRHHVEGSADTVWMQAFAWMVGGLLLVSVDGFVRDQVSDSLAIALAVVTLLATGAIVAAIQGVVLVRHLPPLQLPQNGQ